MTFAALIAVLALIGLLLLIASGRNIRRRRMLLGLLEGAGALGVFFIAGGALLLAANLDNYRQLIAEQAAGQLQFTRLGYHQFNGVFTLPSGERTDFALRGDEWQIDARILKWRTLANLVGVGAAYRLERISGRYTSVDDERSQPRTVYPLNAPDRIDVWELLHRYQAWLPWLDASYGSAAFLPMADGAQYQVTVSPSGLVARPLNQAAQAAVGSWH